MMQFQISYVDFHVSISSAKNSLYLRFSIKQVKFRWVWTMPFGVPVVPLEYINHTKESKSISSRSGQSIASTYYL